MSAVKAELKTLGDAISNLREVRTLCDPDGIGLDVRRVGAAASIFYLRCMILTSDSIGDKEAALKGISEQYLAVTSAVFRLMESQYAHRIAFAIDPIDRASHAAMLRARTLLQHNLLT